MASSRPRRNQNRFAGREHTELCSVQGKIMHTSLKKAERYIDLFGEADILNVYYHKACRAYHVGHSRNIGTAAQAVSARLVNVVILPRQYK